MIYRLMRWVATVAAAVAVVSVVILAIHNVRNYGLTSPEGAVPTTAPESRLILVDKGVRLPGTNVGYLSIVRDTETGQEFLISAYSNGGTAIAPIPKKQP